jgi:ABC-type nitrate/sulfonate/bicarbonate transport system ATPase subunit
MISVQFNQVSFRYAREPARHTRQSPADAPSDWLLKDFSLDLRRTGVTVILGASGSGKSTLLSLVANLFQPHAGTVQISGSSHTDKWPPVGMVFQTPALLPWRSVLDNAVFGAQMSGLAPTPQIYEKARGLLTRHGLGEYLQSFPRELSMGMQQRVSVIRAMVAEAEVVLLDEPFSSLDFLSRRDLQQEVSSLVDRTRVVAILVTHDLDDAFRLGDEVMIIGRRPLQVLDRFVLPGERKDRLTATNLQLSEYAERVWRCQEGISDVG